MLAQSATMVSQAAEYYSWSNLIGKRAVDTFFYMHGENTLKTDLMRIYTLIYLQQCSFNTWTFIFHADILSLAETSLTHLIYLLRTDSHIVFLRAVRRPDVWQPFPQLETSHFRHSFSSSFLHFCSYIFESMHSSLNIVPSMQNHTQVSKHCGQWIIFKSMEILYFTNIRPSCVIIKPQFVVFFFVLFFLVVILF